MYLNLTTLSILLVEVKFIFLLPQIAREKSTRRLELVVVFRGMDSSYIRQQTSVRTLIYYVNTHNDDDSLILTSRQRPSTFFTILHTPSRAEKKKLKVFIDASFLILKFTVLIRSIFFSRKKAGKH